MDWSQWTKVITHPLGLAGFALALVFWFVSTRRASAPPWLQPAFLAMAAVALIGGLFLGYRQTVPTSTPPTPSATPSAHQPGEVEASTAGDCAPAVAGSQISGGININCPKTEAPKPSEKP